MNNYKSKYLKYKQKYLKLKNIIDAKNGGFGLDDIPENLHEYVAREGNVNGERIKKLYKNYYNHNEEKITEEERIIRKNKLEKDVFETSVVDITYDDVINPYAQHNLVDPYEDIVGAEYRDKLIELLFGLLRTYKEIKESQNSQNNDDILLKIINVPGDGNCFFHCIYLYLKLSKCNPDFNMSCSTFDKEKKCMEKMVDQSVESATDKILNHEKLDETIKLQSISELRSAVRDVKWVINIIAQNYKLNILILKFDGTSNAKDPVNGLPFCMLEFCDYKGENVNDVALGNVILLNLGQTHFNLIYLNVSESKSDHGHIQFLQTQFFENVLFSYQIRENYNLCSVRFHEPHL